MLRSNGLARGLLAAGLALGFAAPVLAQAGDPAGPAAGAVAPAEPPVPESIPVPMIAEGSDQLRATFRKIREQIAPDRRADSIAQELDVLSEVLASEKGDVSELLTEEPTRDQIADADRRWIGYAQKLVGWRDVLSNRATTIEEQVARLDEAEQTWKVTLEAATEAAAPPEIGRALRKNLSDISAMRDEVGVVRTATLALLDHVSQQEVVVDEVRADLSRSLASIRAGLFEPDGDPLWTATFARPAEEPLTTRLMNDLRDDWRQVSAYVDRAGREFVPLGFFFAIALGVAFFVRQRIRGLADTDELRGSAAIFDRPISIASLATFLLFAWVFPDAPVAFSDALGLLLIFPILHLATTLVVPSFRPVLLVIGAFYFVDQLRAITDSLILFRRYVLVAQCVLALGILYWMLQPARLAGLPAGASLPRWVGTGMRLAGILLLACILANLLGYVSFARVLGDGVFQTVYLAVVLFAAFKISQTVLVLCLRSEAFQRLGVVRAESREILRWAPRVLGAIAAYVGVRASLASFGILVPVQGWVVDVFTTPLVLGTASISLWDVTSILIVLFAAWLFSRFVQTILKDAVFPRVQLGRGVGAAVSTTAQYVILVSGFLLALSAAGIDLSKFTILAGAFGVGIGFGMQNIVNNFVSGLILLYERPIQVGDTIQLTDQMGTVTRIGVRSSTLETFKGAEVIVPNANLISEQVVNWTLSDATRRIELPVGVAYGSDHEQVLRVLQDSSAGHPEVLDFPGRQVLFRGFGESSLDFEIRLWTRSATWTQVASDVLGNVYKGLNEAEIEIPFPQRDLHVRSVDGEAARRFLGDAEPPAQERSVS